MTCKDCIHSEICLEQYSQLNPDMMFNECKKFKNKADYAEVKHGEWIIDNSIEERTFYDTNYKILITCNICGNRHFLGTQSYRKFTQEDLKEDACRKYRYCGECGAKMDGSDKK